jgi:curved DNA-binding protein
MEFRDYYKTLGVPPDADDKAIRKAFRKLAREYHPDVNPGNKDLAEKFKEINEANQVLSDPAQRKKYDEMRTQYERWKQSGGQGREFNFDQWSTAQAGAPPYGGGGQTRYATAEDLEDLFGGEGGYSDFFSSLFGQGRGPQASARPRPGRDIEYPVEVTLAEAFHGTKRIFQIGERRIEAQIPRGAHTGARVRLAGQGEPGRNGGPPGDLYLVVHVLPDPAFEREGDDLYTELPVDIYTAALGGEVKVPTLGKPVLLKIPPGTQAGRSFRLKGKGMPRLGDPATRGDLYARIRLELPEPLTEHEIIAFRELQAAREKAGAS